MLIDLIICIIGTCLICRRWHYIIPADIYSKMNIVNVSLKSTRNCTLRQNMTFHVNIIKDKCYEYLSVALSRFVSSHRCETDMNNTGMLWRHDTKDEMTSYCSITTDRLWLAKCEKEENRFSYQYRNTETSVSVSICDWGNKSIHPLWKVREIFQIQSH